MPIKTKKNIFAPGVILMSIFQLLQVHIIPREIVGVAMGYSNDNLANLSKSNNLTGFLTPVLLPETTLQQPNNYR